MKSIFVVTDANYGAIAFTTLNKALDYIFGDNESVIAQNGLGDEDGISKRIARQEVLHGYQYSGELPYLGSFTLTEAPLLNRNVNVDIWREIE